MATAILDIDGTLVDTNYHHTMSWARALAHHDLVVPLWRIHRHIGMGGDQVVSALCDDRTEAERGESIRAAEAEEFSRLIDEVRLFAGARELILALRDRGHVVVLASSARPGEADHYLDLLDARTVVDAWTTADDVEATKPAPDLVRAALATVDQRADDAVMVGDTPWDIRSAAQADVPTVAVITGGFSGAELTDAGAVQVFESVAELGAGLDSTDLR